MTSYKSNILSDSIHVSFLRLIYFLWKCYVVLGVRTPKPFQIISCGLFFLWIGKKPVIQFYTRMTLRQLEMFFDEPVQASRRLMCRLNIKTVTCRKTFLSSLFIKIYKWNISMRRETKLDVDNLTARTILFQDVENTSSYSWSESWICKSFS